MNYHETKSMGRQTADKDNVPITNVEVWQDVGGWFWADDYCYDARGPFQTEDDAWSSYERCRN